MAGSGVTTSSGAPTCPSVWNAALTRYEAICTATLTATVPYYLRVRELSGHGDVLHTIWVLEP